MSQTKAELINAKGDAAFDTNTLFIDSANNRVGIGITSPAAALHISNSVAEIRLTDSDGDGDYANIISGATGNLFLSADAGNGGANSFMSFQVDNSEKARIDSSGRLLVGTSSYSGNSAFVITGGAAQNVGLVDVRYGTTRPTTADVQVSEIRFGSTDFTSNSAYANIQCVTDGASSSDADIPGRLVFSTTADGASSPTERMRIRNDGEIWVGTTTGALNTSSFGTNIRGTGAIATSRDVTTSAVVQFFGSLGEFRTLGNGNAQNTNNSYGAISDIGLKENIIDASAQWEDIKALKVRKYNFKKETGYNTHTQIGLVAQEVELTSPGLVNEYIDENTGESTKCIDYSVLYMKAVKALQEAMERIEQLEAKVAALESA